MNINQNLMFKFFSREATPQETDALTAWLKEDSSHEIEFNKAYELFVITQVMAYADVESLPKKQKSHRWLWTAVSVAAALLIGVFTNDIFVTRPIIEKIENTTLVSQSQLGQMSKVTLSDGTVVELNSNSRIEYPAIFHDGERRVRLEGEAMFDVAYDANHPFIVETFAYDVKVLGTKFDVIADSGEGEFSTALLEGKVNILDKSERTLISLKPNMVATLKDGSLVCSQMTDRDAYLWTGGVISATGLTFTELMKRFERCYGVNIEIASAKVPEIRYVYFKLRISDGIAHAMNLLKGASDFEYKYNEETNTYTIY